MYQYEDNDRGKGKGGVVTVTIRFVQDDLTKRAKCYCLSRSDTSITEKRTIPALENINHRVLNNSNEANNMFVLKQLKRCMCFTQHTCRKVFFLNKKKTMYSKSYYIGHTHTQEKVTCDGGRKPHKMFYKDRKKRLQLVTQDGTTSRQAHPFIVAFVLCV